ncbi:type II toxin-antitoxin system VapC family toxin [Candidatus Fukatsuia symbiotica]|uniref:VapC toxin family PIN domain ribonuclease n=1 Tax=Candidatus Fukatsuia symbiotica TaxID=1878942 RepID=A0A2U8I967_9GAMM|nr:type II toxin-antitoxin system VapC family toxin [Candidatus Fukatsuia symbiotica]AWK15653.1 VapC toxin family PIN domain ribonuclease [Candidatus Fukatsuia symbiotica]MEA9446179.1 type II toxin-antitoxin system VapC family toxin [Candidatus Fukatsuia symbiotica]
MKLAIDTNVVLRYLLADDIKQATIARKVMKEAILVTIPLPVLCEVVWNLSRGYKLANEDIADAIGILIEADNVKVNQGAVDAGIAMLRSGGDFADGVIAYEGFALGGEIFATFDKKAVAILKKLGSIRTQLLS